MVLQCSGLAEYMGEGEIYCIGTITDCKLALGDLIIFKGNPSYMVIVDGGYMDSWPAILFVSN